MREEVIAAVVAAGWNRARDRKRSGYGNQTDLHSPCGDKIINVYDRKMTFAIKHKGMWFSKRNMDLELKLAEDFANE